MYICTGYVVRYSKSCQAYECCTSGIDDIVPGTLSMLFNTSLFPSKVNQKGCVSVTWQQSLLEHPWSHCKLSLVGHALISSTCFYKVYHV